MREKESVSRVVPIHDMHQLDNVKWGWFIKKHGQEILMGWKHFKKIHWWFPMYDLYYICVCPYVQERYGSRKALFWEGQSHPEVGAAGGAAPGSAQPLWTPRRVRRSLLSLALILQFEKELLVSAQVSFLVLGSYNLKNSNFCFFFKGKSWYSSTKK